RVRRLATAASLRRGGAGGVRPRQGTGRQGTGRQGEWMRFRHRTGRPRVRLVRVLMALLLAGWLACSHSSAGTALAQEPGAWTVDVSPPGGVCEGAVTLTGSGFPPSADVYVCRFDGLDQMVGLARVEADSSGALQSRSPSRSGRASGARGGRWCSARAWSSVSVTATS